VTFAGISADRNRGGDDAEAAARDGPDRPQVPRTGGDCDRQPDANRHRQVADQMNLHATAGSGEPCGTAVRIAPADPLDGQMVQPPAVSASKARLSRVSYSSIERYPWLNACPRRVAVRSRSVSPTRHGRMGCGLSARWSRRRPRGRVASGSACAVRRRAGDHYDEAILPDAALVVGEAVHPVRGQAVLQSVAAGLRPQGIDEEPQSRAIQLL
jgi:hypothetical protein